MDNLRHVTGLADLQKFLDELPVKVERNIMRGALRAGAIVVRDGAAENLIAHGNVKSGKLVSGLKVGTSVKRGIVIASVKVRGVHAYVAKWLEFTGAAPHKIFSKTGKAITFFGALYAKAEHPGFAPKPFLRPALDTRAGAALVAVGEYIKRRLTKQGLDAAEIDIGEV